MLNFWSSGYNLLKPIRTTNRNIIIHWNRQEKLLLAYSWKWRNWRLILPVEQRGATVGPCPHEDESPMVRRPLGGSTRQDPSSQAPPTECQGLKRNAENAGQSANVEIRCNAVEPIRENPESDRPALRRPSSSALREIVITFERPISITYLYSSTRAQVDEERAPAPLARRRCRRKLVYLWEPHSLGIDSETDGVRRNLQNGNDRNRSSNFGVEPA